MTTNSFDRYCQRLAAACAAIDLATAVLRNPPQIRVWDPSLECFAELVSCREGREGAYFVWSWGAQICMATRAAEGAEAIARLVSPTRRRTPSRRSPR
jgi:hypothetical protein